MMLLTNSVPSTRIEGLCCLDVIVIVATYSYNMSVSVHFKQ